MTTIQAACEPCVEHLQDWRTAELQVHAEQRLVTDIALAGPESKNGRREVLFSHKKKQVARPLSATASRVGDDLYKLEVDVSLGKGEYSITPNGSNQVFCFRVY